MPIAEFNEITISEMSIYIDSSMDNNVDEYDGGIKMSEIYLFGNKA